MPDRGPGFRADRPELGPVWRPVIIGGLRSGTGVNGFQWFRREVETQTA